MVSSSRRRHNRAESARVGVDGKFFALNGARFQFRGVTYGTFRPRDDGARFPSREQIKLDFAAMNESGFTVVRTYTEPPDDVVDIAADWDLRLLAGVFTPDWRYLVGSSRRQRAASLRAGRQHVRQAARRFAGSEQILGLCIGNEIPADVIRWNGTAATAAYVDALVEAVREEDSDQLVTYANYPTTEYLPLTNVDFVTFNVYLEAYADFRRYLSRLQNLTGDRPLVLGELGFHAGDDAGGEAHQAKMLDWQLDTAIERGVAGTCVFSWTDEWWVGEAPVDGWRFGLTTTDRRARPALDVVAQWNRRTVRDLDFRWPSMSVVVCAYNAAATLDECLEHTCALDYPGLEILVVDDGSTDATAEIARRHDRSRLIEIAHGGLSVARNAGFQAANGELIAYLDSDAYPSPEWPYYLALAFDRATVGGAGGPNVPPRDDPIGAHVVAQAPGGPVHVLVSDDRAEHVPGCNMAFWKPVLEEVGGFDPIYTSAGDDVDLCWKVLDREWQIGFHPAALVWHHRRPGLRAYLRQQRGYGRSEALVEARHPDRFTPVGTARWKGRIYNSFAPSVMGQRVYRGPFGAAAFQSVYRSGGHALDLAHQVGVPVATLALPLGVLALLHRLLLAVPALAAAYLATIVLIDTVRAHPPRTLRNGRMRFRLSVAVHHLLQPLVRALARARSRRSAWRELPEPVTLPAELRQVARGVLLMPARGPRPELTVDVVEVLRRTGHRVIKDTGWEDHDARVECSLLVDGDLQTSAYPEGAMQLRIRTRAHWSRVVLATATILVLAMLHFGLALGAAAVAIADALRGIYWARRGLFRRLLAARRPGLSGSRSEPIPTDDVTEVQVA